MLFVICIAFFALNWTILRFWITGVKNGEAFKENSNSQRLFWFYPSLFSLSFNTIFSSTLMLLTFNYVHICLSANFKLFIAEFAPHSTSWLKICWKIVKWLSRISLPTLKSNAFIIELCSAWLWLRKGSKNTTYMHLNKAVCFVRIQRECID